MKLNIVGAALACTLGLGLAGCAGPATPAAPIQTPSATPAAMPSATLVVMTDYYIPEDGAMLAGMSSVAVLDTSRKPSGSVPPTRWARAPKARWMFGKSASQPSTRGSQAPWFM